MRVCFIRQGDFFQYNELTQTEKQLKFTHSKLLDSLEP